MSGVAGDIRKHVDVRAYALKFFLNVGQSVQVESD